MLILQVWQDRPAVPKEAIIVQPEKYAGKAVSDKLNDVRLS